MRTAAEIEPVALAVDLDRLAGRDGVDQLDLEQLVLVAEDALGLLARHDLLGERLVARDDLAHLLLDGREVLGRERLVAEEVVIEPVLDHRPDGDLGPGPERLHRLRQHVGAIVADQLEAAPVIAGEKLDARVALDRIGEIGDDALERHRHRALGERRRDALGDVETGCAVGIVPTGAVGKRQGDHDVLVLTRCVRMQVSGFSSRAFSARIQRREQARLSCGDGESRVAYPPSRSRPDVPTKLV